MKVLENIASDLEQRITDASIGNSSRPTILFCGCDPRLKKDLHKRAKRIGLNYVFKSFNKYLLRSL